MTEQKAYQILGLDEGTSMEEVKHAWRILIKKYHQDSEEANRKKFDEANEAYSFLKNIEEKRKEEANKTNDTRPSRNKNNKSSSNSSQKEEIKRFSSRKKQKDNEEAFDELINFKSANEEVLKSLNINVHPKYNEKFLNINNKGIINVSEIKEEQERLNKAFTNIINNALEFDMLKETIDNSRKKLIQLDIGNINLLFNKKNNIREELRGKVSAIELKKICTEIESIMKQVEKNVEELNAFFAYIDSISEEIKRIAPEINIEEIKEKLEKQKGILNAEEIKKQKEQLLSKIESKEECVNSFRKFYDEIEARIKTLYNCDLTMWNDYNNKANIYIYSEDVLNNIKKEIESYESILKERVCSYDNFIYFYEAFTEEEKALFRAKIDIDNYISKDKRLLHSKEDYAKIKEKILELKEDKDLKEKIQHDRIIKERFINFFYEKSKILHDEFGVDLEKWAIFASEENNFCEEDYLAAKKEILAFEEELKTKKDNFLKEAINKENNNFFEKIICDEAKKSIERLKEEKKKKEDYLEAYKEFVAFFDLKEKELNKLYRVSLNKWRKYKDNSNYTIKDLKEAYNEIMEFEQTLRENACAYDDFVTYYESLFEEDKELYSIFNVDKYLSKDNRTSYSKEVYGELKNRVLSHKREKELREKQERYRKIKEDFITFFNEKEKLFKRLYNTDLYKWRPYGKEENDFTEDDYFNVREEITTYESLKENERMNALERLKNALDILSVNIGTYLEKKKKDIKTVSINDIAIYNEILFNISYIVSKIKKISGGEDKLKAHLEEKKKTVLEIPASELEELYKKICIEEEKEKIKKNKQDKEYGYNCFKEFYLVNSRRFMNLYGRDISSYEYLLKEENKDKFMKEDYDNAIKYIKDIGNKLEEKRMSLAYNLQDSLIKLGLDVKDYLEVRKKDLLAVSIEELEKYKESVESIHKICADEELKKALIDYLESNNVKLIELDDNEFINTLFKEEEISEKITENTMANKK